MIYARVEVREICLWTLVIWRLAGVVLLGIWLNAPDLCPTTFISSSMCSYPTGILNNCQLAKNRPTGLRCFFAQLLYPEVHPYLGRLLLSPQSRVRELGGLVGKCLERRKFR